MLIVNSLMATLHRVLAFTLTAALVYEFVAYRSGLTVAEARRIQRVDLVYGISAGLLIAVGLLRVFFFEKGPNFYLNSHVFGTFLNRDFRPFSIIQSRCIIISCPRNKTGKTT
jgi:putative membrane protein